MVAMVILPFSLGIGRADDDHLEDDAPGHGHLGPAFLVLFASYGLKQDLGI